VSSTEKDIKNEMGTVWCGTDAVAISVRTWPWWTKLFKHAKSNCLFEKLYWICRKFRNYCICLLHETMLYAEIQSLLRLTTKNGINLDKLIIILASDAMTSVTKRSSPKFRPSYWFPRFHRRDRSFWLTVACEKLLIERLRIVECTV